MPTYEYACNDCHHHFDEFQSITAEPLKVCPKCGGTVYRLISPGNGFIFKGSGFYITDYKKSNNGPAKKSAKTEKAPKTEKKDSEKSS
ncbi:MAG: FmdB family zinc ribbon protein [bacterium]